MKNNRSNQIRNEETTRDNSRASYNFNRNNPLALPPGVKKEGYAYRWVNTNIRGVDGHRVQTSILDGWKIVPADRSSINYFSRSERDPGTMNFKDVILMEREEELSKQERQYQDQIAQERVSSLKGVSYSEEVRPYFLKSIGKY